MEIVAWRFADTCVNDRPRKPLDKLTPGLALRRQPSFLFHTQNQCTRTLTKLNSDPLGLGRGIYNPALCGVKHK